MSCHYYDELGHRCECFPSEVADKLTIASETIADLRDTNEKLKELVKDLLHEVGEDCYKCVFNDDCGAECVFADRARELGN